MSGPSISTHVLDTERGQPAVGVPVTLARLAGEQFMAVARATTDADGRIAELLADALQPGAYQLSFDVAAYWRARGEEVAFLRRATIEFEIHDAARHYHVPLLLSRYSCTSYRGS